MTLYDVFLRGVVFVCGVVNMCVSSVNDCVLLYELVFVLFCVCVRVCVQLCEWCVWKLLCDVVCARVRCL